MIIALAARHRLPAIIRFATSLLNSDKLSFIGAPLATLIES